MVKSNYHELRGDKNVYNLSGKRYGKTARRLNGPVFIIHLLLIPFHSRPPTHMNVQQPNPGSNELILAQHQAEKRC